MLASSTLGPRLRRPLFAGLFSAIAVTHASIALAAPIELSAPIDVGATLPAIVEPPDGSGEFLDERRDDYAVAPRGSSMLVTWVEGNRDLYAAILDAEQGVVVPRFLVYSAETRLYAVRAVFADGAYRIAVGEQVGLYAATRLFSVDEAGTVGDDGTYGLEEQGLVECSPLALEARSTGLVLSCTSGVVVAFPKAGEPSTLFSPTSSPRMDIACRAAQCVAGFQLNDSNPLRNVALVALDDANTDPKPTFLGFRDATYARIAVALTGAGTLAVSWSYFLPPGDSNGQNREHIHGWFLAPDGTIRALDNLAEAPGIRDPRLATNGTSVALAYRANGGGSSIVALDADGAPRGETAVISTQPSLDIRLAASSDGSYALAYDDGARLFVRTARLDPKGEDTGAGGGTTTPTETSSGCAVAGGGASSSAGAALVVAFGASLVVRRRRRRG
ncbi:MYXO-CTERM sorting domain-containing protein [Polyangium sp. y55x31]|uniref:MYXO-CTERM sorting domain-containing protein n=1 Tax=Polyangium sp. y55x31 TaxID=3042688 RepID=UPI0024828636|nr:MYXO-CTERM sorting domain-containing protein [Polyangium sp. y55x31]MDI1482838.1 MYXO-CTERM sorting domain-containing protein [Polyangium sp. y55x31]